MKRLKHKHKGETRFVRIDPRTVIEADINIPIEKVREKYALNHIKNMESIVNPPKNMDFFR